MTTQPRQPTGTPVGGQFAATDRPRAAVALADPDDRLAESVGGVFGGADDPPRACDRWEVEPADKYEEQVFGLIRDAAGLRGVHAAAMAEQYQAYYEQYLALPEDARPVPPTAWLVARKGSYVTRYVQKDPAASWAAYRCQSDPDGLQGEATYASVDLETAGPPMPAGRDPERGCIIEVGVIVYDHTGAELSRYSTLAFPDVGVAAQYGTGAVEVHGITFETLKGAPEWDHVAADVTGALDGHVILAHNARFENSFLGHHLPLAGQGYDTRRGCADTAELAMNNFAFENHQLRTVCGELGVEYTAGHRAVHDAEVAGAAFFAMRERLFAEYRAGGYDLPQP